MKIRLDPRTVAGLVLPKGKPEDFAWDADLENFGLRLRRRRDGGVQRTWVTQYRANGHTRRCSIGSADNVTPAQARDAARKILAKVELGADPQLEREEKRRQASRTFRAVVETYLAAKQAELRPASYRVTRLYLTGGYFKPLHAMPITAVRRSDVASCIRGIACKRSASTAAAARRALSAFFAWAIADGLLGDGANPVDGSHRPANPQSRDHVLTDSELVAVWNACSDGEDFSRVVRLLILLGSRRQEVGGMRWSELDFDGGTWCLPKERS